MTPSPPAPLPGTAPVNTLYYGDNLDVLRRHVAAASVDLIYLDPPFNSHADDNVLFAERDGTPGTRAHAQFQAFGDTRNPPLHALRPETASTHSL